jgi:hypothetical protein
MLIRLEGKKVLQPTLLRISILLITSTMIIMIGNLLQIASWAVLFYLFDEFQNFSTAFYHSVVNFSTLGYGDIVMSEKRRLLGALEATNGVLMFGLTTGFLYTVLNAMLRRRWDERIDQTNKQQKRRK